MTKFSQQDILDKWVKQKECCHFCRVKISRTIQRNSDHKIPPAIFSAYLNQETLPKKEFVRNDVRVNAKVDNDRSNLMILCLECNSKKGQTTYYNYIENNKDFFELFGWKITSKSIEYPNYDDEDAKWTYALWDNFRDMQPEEFIENYLSKPKSSPKSETKKKPSIKESSPKKNNAEKPSSKKNHNKDIKLTIKKNSSVIESPKFKILEDGDWHNLTVFLKGSIGDENDELIIGENTRIKNKNNSLEIIMTDSAQIKTEMEYYYEASFFSAREWTTIEEVYLCYEDGWDGIKRVSKAFGKEIIIK